MENKIKSIVIGSGFGGLAAAIRLQAAGHEVTLLEKRDLPGGRAYVYQDQGFTFDAGPTVITAPHCLDELFELAGKKREDYVEFLPVSPLYRLHWEDGTVFDYTNDMDATLAQIKKLNPKDAENYPRFLEYTREVFDKGYTELAHVPFLNFSSMIRCAPDLLKLQAFRSVYGIVSKYLQSPYLRQAFSFHSLLVGGNPYNTSAIYTLIHFLERKWGVFFAKGGTGALVRALVKLFEDIGGKVRYQAEVAEIMVEQGAVRGVILKNGEKLMADRIVSNADVAHTYRDLLKNTREVKARAKRVVNQRYSMSLFVLYFGTRKTYPNIAHHSVLFGSRYKELLKDIFKRGVLAEDFSLYLHAPCRTDKSMAPEGGEAFYALSPVPHLGIGKTDWKTEGPIYAQKILKYLDERYLPGLRENLVTQRFFTPDDFTTELNAHLGSAFSLEPVLQQSAYFRVSNREPDVKGLYFVGAGTHPGAGIPGVVNSAKATAGLVIEDDRPRAVAVAVPAYTPKVQSALAECKKMIEVGSKSFSLAAKLFDESTRDAAFFLYGWCRYCDDQIDRAKNLRIQEERVKELRAETEKAFDGQPCNNPVFIALSHIAKQYNIPRHYALELIEGMAMDVRREAYWTIDDLRLYCYRVAGTVGLMMSHVMGVSDPRALRHAADLGSAMQLTNIARDVREDAEMGRVYLPLLWMDEAGVPEGQIMQPRYRASVAQVVKRLLGAADGYYASGAAGLKYLPWRAAIAVSVASEVYSQIGRQVLARGERAWDSRTIVSKWGKAWAVMRGTFRVLLSAPQRIFLPWKRVEIQQIWRHA